MVRIAVVALFAAVWMAAAANPPSGHAADESVEVSAVFLDAAAVRQAAGSDFNSAYTVVEVTVTPKGGKTLDIEPDDFLMRIESNSDRSQPLAASEVLAVGGLVLHKEEQQVIGINRTETGYNGVKEASAGTPVATEAINALKAKMIPAGKTSSAVTGLLFFPMAKKKAKDLDLVYTSPLGKLHVSFR